MCRYIGWKESADVSVFQERYLNMAGASSVAGEVFVDALPYFDQGYDAPGVREAVST